MSMLNLSSNQAAVEAICSGTYLDNYLDTLEDLPAEIQRHVTQLRELDIQTQGRDVTKTRIRPFYWLKKNTPSIFHCDIRGFFLFARL